MSQDCTVVAGGTTPYEVTPSADPLSAAAPDDATVAPEPHLWAIGIRSFLVFTLLLGVGYPAVVTGIGQLAFPRQAGGSLLRREGAVVGSALLGQPFTDAAGEPLPQYFAPRPSANNYDALDSGGSNQGPEDPRLIAAVAARRAAIAAFNQVPPSAVPPDALTASGSGLDPHISPAYAQLQVARVAQARNLSPAEVEALVAAHTTGASLGFVGQPSVNVVTLNLALDELAR